MANLLPGLPTGEFTWDLTYKFKNDEYYAEDGVDYDYSQFSYATRELSLNLGESGEAGFEFLSRLLAAGVTSMLVPLWFQRTSIAAGITAGVSTEVKVLDVSEFYVDDYVWFIDTRDSFHYELKTITAIAGSTIFLDSPVTYTWHPIGWPSIGSPYYDSSSVYVVPAMWGYIDYENVDYIRGKPGIDAKLKLNGGRWDKRIVESTSTYTVEPHGCSYGTPRVYRDVLGAENGMLQLTPYGSTSKLVFNCQWDFKDSSWGDLRDLFLAARGKEGTFYMSTGVYEVSATQSSDAGSTTIYLQQGYENLRGRFPTLRFRPRRFVSPFTVTTTAHVSYDEFSCNALPYKVELGDRASFYPLVRFNASELKFSFSGVHKCTVQTSFVDVPS